MNNVTTPVDIRSVAEKDLPSLLNLAEEFMPGKADKKKRMVILKQALKDPNYVLWMAELGKEIIGFIDQWLMDDFVHGAKLSFIQNLYVNPQYRERGAASKLLQKAMEDAKNRGATEIHVTTEFENKPAINLYRKHGLVEEHLQLEKGC